MRRIIASLLLLLPLLAAAAEPRALYDPGWPERVMIEGIYPDLSGEIQLNR